MSTGDQAAAADPTLFDTDPLQPGEIHSLSWMLYTCHALNLCPQEDKEEKSNGRKDTRRTSKSK